MRYGSVEYAYAEPFANALVDDPAFRTWVLQQTKFATLAEGARPLYEEMKAKRSPSADSWWRSHYTERCRCQGCSGQETDLLAIFEAKNGTRFALHVEVKQPADNFSTKRDQAANYALRAKCWARSAPDAVLPHADADTVLLFSASKRGEYAPHIPKFGTALTFEEVASVFPRATFS